MLERHYVAVFTVLFCLVIILYLYSFPLPQFISWLPQSSRIFGVGCETDLRSQRYF